MRKLFTAIGKSIAETCVDVANTFFILYFRMELPYCPEVGLRPQMNERRTDIL